MAGLLTLTVPQRVALAEKLGIDPLDLDEAELLRQAEKLAARAKRSVAYEDTTGILKTDTLDSAPRTKSARNDPADRALDAAIARGAVDYEERDAWRRQYERAPEAVGEILDGLPSDPARGERAYASDRRLRDLQEAFDDYLGVPAADRVVQYADDGDELRDPTGLFRFDA